MTEKEINQLQDENQLLKNQLGQIKQKIADSKARKISRTKKVASLVAGSRLKHSIAKTLDEFNEGKVSRDTIAELVASIFKRLVRVGFFPLFIATIPIFINIWQNIILTSQNKIITEQNMNFKEQLLDIEVGKYESIFLDSKEPRERRKWAVLNYLRIQKSRFPDQQISLRSAYLSDCSFRDEKSLFTNVSFEGAVVDNLTFSNVNLDQSSFRKVVQLDSTSIWGFKTCTVSNSNFTEASVRNIVIYDCDMTNTSIFAASLANDTNEPPNHWAILLNENYSAQDRNSLKRYSERIAYTNDDLIRIHGDVVEKYGLAYKELKDRERTNLSPDPSLNERVDALRAKQRITANQLIFLDLFNKNKNPSSD
ncbi:MAG: pentapeptide repeat-containing protein [Bacteroidota bacterium]